MTTSTIIRNKTCGIIHTKFINKFTIMYKKREKELENIHNKTTTDYKLTFSRKATTARGGGTSG